MQQNYLYDQLEFNKLEWYDKKADTEERFQLARERLEKKAASWEASGRHEFGLALVN
ncbi:hypothetical protein PHMEG_0009960 [Phytophthora megakarya]|uniref:Uncharacterized protein n=1 Tax=Phytophthora megakarya TaxID=4795 RepID=A0A225WFT5_9STRA|nr:hypothetical protein PHMEG_0009960 [Phytophthora megakarya]